MEVFEFDAQAHPAPRARSRSAALMAAALVLVGVLGYGYAATEHHVFDLGYSLGPARATVATWSVKLPFGGRLFWKQSTPAGPSDGFGFVPGE